MSTAFVTGFPGFIGIRLIKNLLAKRPELGKFYLLVQRKYLELAKRTLEKINTEFPNSSARFEILIGDITLPDLGLSNSERVKEEVNEFFHLAAVYDLAVSRELGMRVNVEGTKNIVKFLTQCRNLIRHHYVSTAYVSGWASGVFKETDLDVGQSFKNFYEETKFLAEKVVQESMSEIPTTIYRPGIVVGDSKTGETAKFDGPYYVILFMMKLPSYSLFPKVGSGEAEVNIVPVDYVVEAMTYLSGVDKSVGKVYHLVDPRPHRVFELVELFAQKLGKKFIYFKISPHGLKILMKPSFVRKLTGMPVQLIDYFDHQVHYDCTNALSDLGGSGIKCPDVYEYVDVMLKFARENKDRISSRGLV